MTKRREQAAVFSIGAVVYSLIELLWRHHTHWTMTLTGGACFSILYNLYSRFRHLTLGKKCLIGSAVITGIEFTVGILVNIWRKWNVWDYSDMKFNFLGQICALYSFFWFLLSAPIALVSSLLHHRLRRIN